MDIECQRCKKQIPISSIWTCRRNDADYCNSCISDRLREDMKEIEKRLQATKALLEDDDFKGTPALKLMSVLGDFWH